MLEHSSASHPTAPVSQVELIPAGPHWERLVFSRLVFGAWRLADRPEEASVSQVVEKLQASLDLGITTFDHADIYGNYACEALFGEALAALGAARDRLQLVTKCGIKLVSERRPAHGIKHYDTSRTHIRASVENSLKLLRTDRVELLLIHRPDPLLDPEEVADCFAALRQEGKVLHFGVSNFTPSQLELLAARMAERQLPLVTNQVEVSLLHLEPLHDGTLDQCLQRRIKPMAWSPMGGGRLFTQPDGREGRVRQALQEVAAALTLEGQGALGPVSLEQVALAWLLRHPSQLLPVLGTGRLSRLRDAAEAEHLSLSREQWFRLWCASAGRDVP